MFNYTLQIPVFMKRQLPALAKAMRLTVEEVWDVLYGLRPISFDGKDFTLCKEESQGVMIGAEAAAFLAEKFADLNPVKEINIGSDVFMECDPDTWFDITAFCYHLEQRIVRFNKLTNLGAPAVIIGNEYRLIYEGMEQLECNYLEKEGKVIRCRRGDGFLRRHLNCIGYSLIDGWHPEKRKQLERVLDQQSSLDAEIEAARGTFCEEE